MSSRIFESGIRIDGSRWINKFLWDIRKDDICRLLLMDTESLAPFFKRVIHMDGSWWIKKVL